MSQLQEFEKIKSLIGEKNTRLLQVYFEETGKHFAQVVYSFEEWKKFEDWKALRYLNAWEEYEGISWPITYI